MSKLRVLDLFSGIGGFSLGLERTGGFETVAFCENEEFPCKVLRKNWPDIPIYNDVRDLTAEKLNADGIGGIDVITGGYPCQPFSLAGKRRGAEDDRHLWPEMQRLVATIRPAWVIGENVAGHISMGLDDVLSDLEALGYTTQAFVIPACAVNALHRRDRVWIIGHANEDVGEQSMPMAINDEDGERINEVGVLAVANTAIGRCKRQRASIKSERTETIGTWKTSKSFDALGWPTQPAICGRDHGISARLVSSRLAALGNAVVPQIPQMIGNAILASRETS
jgi:DNA (cytosine-5)-methyltransferase 1